MKKFLFLQLLLTAALGLATAASAGVREGAFTVTPFVGGYTFDGVQHVKTNVVSGLGLGYNMGKNWGAEAQMFYVPVNPAAAGARTTNGYGARLELQYNFIPDSAIVPYLALGGGWMRLDKYNNGSANDDGTADYGAGLKLFVTDSVALRGDARHIFSVHANDGSDDDYWQNFQYTLGVSFQFGGRQAAAPVAAAAPAPPPRTAPVPMPVREEPAAQPVPAPAPLEAPQPKEAEALPRTVPPAPAEAVAATPAKQAPVITAITVARDGVQIVAQGEIGEYKVFPLSRPARLVIDIQGARRGANWAMLPINRHGIAVVRTGQYPDHLRIVLDASGSKLPSYRVVRNGDGLKVELMR